MLGFRKQGRGPNGFNIAKPESNLRSKPPAKETAILNTMWNTEIEENSFHITAEFLSLTISTPQLPHSAHHCHPSFLEAVGDTRIGNGDNSP